MPANKVYLVGSGPGDPLLITVRGARALGISDVVLYDRLSHPRLLDLAPPAAERIYVGKQGAVHQVVQGEIGRLMVDHWLAGRNVVRLKGGDPLLFGRAAEEMEALAAAGVEFEIIPGVSSASGAAAYLGVPLTHPDYADAVALVSGYEAASIDWAALKALDGTVALFMGASQFTEISQLMISAGWDRATPALAVRWATRPMQQVIDGTLGDLAGLMDSARLQPPVLILIGPAVGLRHRYNWFERLPLAGKRIVVTRDRTQASALSDRLEALGAAVIEFPVIAIREPADSGPIDTAIARLDQYDWLIFTSVNGVKYFMDRLDQTAGRDLRHLRAGVKIAAIGPSTKAAIEALHLKVDLMPEDYVAEGVLAAFDRSGETIEGKRVLLPRAAVARDTIPDTLRDRGAIVDVVEAYRTGVPELTGAEIEAAFGAGKRPDWITFTSSSTVKNLLAVAGAERLTGVKVASIGPITSETARKHGLHVDVEAKPFTIDGLVAAIVANSTPALAPTP